jgi:hypothetical protein
MIPLAKKLRECEVFGVDCDQLLDFATQIGLNETIRGPKYSRVEGKNLRAKKTSSLRTRILQSMFASQIEAVAAKAAAAADGGVVVTGNSILIVAVCSAKKRLASS